MTMVFQAGAVPVPWLLSWWSLRPRVSTVVLPTFFGANPAVGLDMDQVYDTIFPAVRVSQSHISTH